MTDHPAFTPVPVRARRDGWTPAIQVDFVAALRRTHNVAAACRAVGRSWQTAYRLRARQDAASFAAAWDAAMAISDLHGPFTGRAMDGLARPIFYRGRQIGERRRYDNRLAMTILRLRAPDRWGVPTGHVATGARDLGDALFALAADLAAGLAPCDGNDSPHDVARGSSPSTVPPRSPKPGGTAHARHLAEYRSLRYGRAIRRAMLAEEGAEYRSSRAVFASARSPPLLGFRMPRLA